MSESFLKRRMGFERGHPLILLDSLDYIFGAYVVAWMLRLTPFNLQYFAIACVMTVPVHMVANFAAYYLKLKKNPW